MSGMAPPGLASREWRAAVIERHTTRVRRYFVNRVSSPSDVEDLTQEACLRFLTMKQGSHPREPLAYLYGIARNVLADYRSSAARRRRHVLFDSELVDECLANPLEAKAAGSDATMLQDQLLRGLMHLPVTHCAVLLAHERDGLSYEETATSLNLSIHTVEKYLTQAKAQLRRMLSK